MTKIYLFRLGRDRPKTVALSRKKDWITGLSFTTDKPKKEDDGDYLTFSSEKLEQAGFIVRFDKAGDAATDVHTGQAPDTGYNLPPTRFKQGHVTVYYPDMAQWDAWHSAELAQHSSQNYVPSQLTVLLYSLREVT